MVDLAAKAQQEWLQGQAITLAMRRGLIDQHGNPVPQAPRPDARAAAPSRVRSLGRSPLVLSRRSSRYTGLPRRISVPLEFQEEAEVRGMYPRLEKAAHELYTGVTPEITLNSWNYPLLQWVLATLLRAAPDDQARIRSLDALILMPGFMTLMSAADAIVGAFVDSGRAGAYRNAFRENLTFRDVMEAAVTDAGVQDAELLAALSMTGHDMPTPGWVKRCRTELLSGTFPTEVRLESHAGGLQLSSVSFWAVCSAVELFATSSRVDLVRGLSKMPGIESRTSAPVCRQFAALLGISSAPDDYRYTLAAFPNLRAAIARALRNADPASVTPEMWAVVGLSPPH